jgi:hypothetical protein
VSPVDFDSTIAIGCGATGDDCARTTHVGDLSGDGVSEFMIGAASYGPAHDRFQAGALYVLGLEDRCEDVPAGFPDDSLRVIRSGDDAVLEFAATDIGRDAVGIDVFRGTIASLSRPAPYDHAVIAGACGAVSAPYVDSGAAAPGVENYYYLVTRGCPAACNSIRLQGSLGSDSFGVPRPLPRNPDPFTCQ